MNRVELKAIITNVGVTPPFWNHSKGKTGTSLTYRQNLYRINDKIPAKSRRSPDNVLKRGEVEICAFLSCVVVSSFETHPKNYGRLKITAVLIILLQNTLTFPLLLEIQSVQFLLLHYC